MSGTKFFPFDTLVYEEDGKPESWPTWESQAQSALVFNNMWGYISGHGVITPPEQINNSLMLPVKINNPKYDDWLDKNLIILSPLHLSMHWDKGPKSHQGRENCQDCLGHTQSGPPANGSIFTTHHTSASACHLLVIQNEPREDHRASRHPHRLFSVQTPTEDLWHCIIYLNTMAGSELKDTRLLLNTLLSAGTLSSASVAARIKHEQVRIDTENAETATTKSSFAAFSRQAAAEALKRAFANGQGPCANPQCTDHTKWFHDWDHCYGLGRHIKPPAATGKAKRGGGKSQKDKAKVAVDSSDESDDQAAFISNSAGYRSFFTDISTPHGETTSFDWSTVSPDIAHLTCNKPDILAALVLYLDTGATSSICPILKYFTKITPCMRNVSGVSGSLIKAIGIGKVRICMGKGHHFILKVVLYCLEAVVTLISVGKLCDNGEEQMNFVHLKLRRIWF
ncbi:hypothetical protein DFH08DRAFT_960434 [Mycena albidolilacea]|uniref:Retrovirus-related Pol polyprotein from transposon TNT 1-94-like beta-barrel domain-containing protein n=1 Tax=Mycena albidolilacea TaxID=1033008 RepID=A0AAD7ESS4_9AGAR|nr:hypothetical protein DFH08DRAFT_960434 [Mycena albidolilacea]